MQQPPAADPFAARQADLARHRVAAEERVREAHIAEARRQPRAIAVGAVAWVAIAAPALGGGASPSAIAAPLAAAAALRLGVAPGFAAAGWSGLAAALVAFAGATRCRPHPLAAALGIAAFAAAGAAVARATAPARALRARGCGPLARAPTIATASTAPEALIARAASADEIAAVNELVRLADDRRAVVRLAALGALAAWTIAWPFSLMAPDPFACTAVVALGGSLGGWIIAARELGPAAAMPLYAALTMPLALLAQACGLAGPLPDGPAAIARIIPLVFALAAWALTGGALALAAERHRVRRLRTA